MTAYLIVRAEVAEADRDAFDRWYEAEHLPAAKAGFRALSARRGWIDGSPGVHLAIYEFPDLAHARGAVNSDAMKALIGEFDRAWQDRVTRRREMLEIGQML